MLQIQLVEEFLAAYYDMYKISINMNKVKTRKNNGHVRNAGGPRLFSGTNQNFALENIQRVVSVFIGYKGRHN